MMFVRIRSPLIAAAICATGGFTFYFLHAPLPWMLGSLSAAALTAILGGRWFLPAAMRRAARPVVGVLTGSAFHAETAAAILDWWDAILLVLGQSLLVTLLGYAFFRKIGGFDRQTALAAGTPGGVGEMALLATSFGGDPRKIVVSHLMRILLVVFAVPVIAQMVVGHPIGRSLPTSPGNAPPALLDWCILGLCAIGGYGLSQAIRFQAGLMICPMLLSAAAHATGLTQAAPPSWLVALVQVLIGGIVGARFAAIGWREMRRTLACAVVWAATLIAISSVSAWAGSWLIGRSFLAMLLALAPGGTVEITILAFSIGFEVAFVVTCQICRILFVLLVAPVFVSLLARKAGPVDPPSGP